MTENVDSEPQRNESEVWFAGNVRPGPGAFQPHAGVDDVIARSIEAVRNDWEVVTRQISRLLENTDPSVLAAGYQMDEVSINLGFTATGKLAFIAEAGVEASITVKFGRRQGEVPRG